MEAAILRLCAAHPLCRSHDYCRLPPLKEAPPASSGAPDGAGDDGAHGPAEKEIALADVDRGAAGQGF